MQLDEVNRLDATWEQICIKPLKSTTCIKSVTFLAVYNAHLSTRFNLQYVYINSSTKYILEQQLSAVIVDVSPKSRYIPVGGTARFSCTSKTSSRYSITWSRENNNPLPSSSHVKDGTLIISNARLGDGGTYICTGKNILNVDRAIISLHVGG